MLYAVSTLVLVIIAMGLWVRSRNRALHMRLMVAAFAIDLASVVVIEVSRSAVKRVARSDMSLIWFHAGVSTLVLVLYVVLLVLGRRLNSGSESSRHAHRRFGIAFCVLRLVNYATSFLVT